LPSEFVSTDGAVGIAEDQESPIGLHRLDAIPPLARVASS
jgi:hypothetical protein